MRVAFYQSTRAHNPCAASAESCSNSIVYMFVDDLYLLYYASYAHELKILRDLL